MLTGLGGIFGGKDDEGPRSAAPAISEFEEKKRVETVDEKEQEEEAETTEVDEVGVIAPSSSSPSPSGGSTLIRRFGSLLVGKGDDTRGHGRTGKRTTILGGFSPRPSADPEEKTVEELVKEDDEKNLSKDKETDGETPTSSMRQSHSQPFSSIHRRAATIFDPHGRTARHERRSSAGAALLSGATIGRRRRPSTASSGVKGMTGADRFAKTDEEDAQETEKGEGTVVNGVHEEGGFREEDERHTSEKDFKPVFLKGLFRYVRIRIGSQ
jgi:serine/threonine protein kinase KIN1/2